MTILFIFVMCIWSSCNVIAYWDAPSQAFTVGVYVVLAMWCWGDIVKYVFTEI